MNTEVERTTMLVYRGDRRFELVEADAVPPSVGDVVVDVLAAGVCGSDVHGYAGVNDRRAPGTVMGHEVVGRVSAIGADVDVEVGQTVAVWPIVGCGACDLCAADQPHLCRRRRIFGCTPELPGGFATQMTVPASNLVAVPGGVTPDWGALIEPLAVGHHAVRLAGEHLGDRVGVIGGGPIGIAIAIAARRRGARSVVIVEPVEHRRRILATLGFDAVLPGDVPDDLITAFECVGHGSTLRATINATRPGGTVVCVGVAEPELTIPMVSLVIEERRLLGSSAYTREDFAETAASLAADDVDLDVLIERRTDLVGAPEVFAEYAAGTTAAIKTLVLPQASKPPA